MKTPIRSALSTVLIVGLLAACSGGGATTAPARTTAPAATTAAPTTAPTTAAATSAPATSAPATSAAASASPSVSAEPSASATAEPTPAASSAAPSPTASDPPGAVEGTLTIWAPGNLVPTLVKVGELFTAEFGVPVSVQEVAFQDMRDRFSRAAPAGQGPDIIVGPHDGIGSYVSNSLLETIDLGDAATGFEESSIRAFTYDGKLVGVPYGIESIALIYNTDLVPTPPATWDELKTMAKELEDSGKAEEGFILLDANPFFAYPVFTGFGGYVFGETDQGYDASDIGLDSPGAIAAATEIRSMVTDGLLTKGMDYETMNTLFKEGKAGMMINGPFALADIESSGVPFSVTKIPPMTETARPFVGVQGFMLSAFSKNKLLAQSFLTETVASDAGQQAIYDGLKQPSAWKALNASISDPITKAFAASAADGDPTPAIPEMGSVWDSWTKACIALFSGEGTPEEVMRQAAQSIRDLLEAS